MLVYLLFNEKFDKTVVLDHLLLLPLYLLAVESHLRWAGFLLLGFSLERSTENRLK